MSNIFCDANVLIYYFSLNAPQQKKATALLYSFIDHGNLLIVTPFILNEVHFIFQKNAQFETSRQVINTILGMKNIKLTDFALKKKDMLGVVNISEKYHLKTSDAFHVYYCKKLKIKKIATFDKDFKKVPWLTILPG